jgi:acyl carrier protein
MPQNASNSTFEKLSKLLIEEADMPSLKVESTTNIREDFGFDSLDVVELIMSIEDVFCVDIPDEAIEGLVTVQDVVNYIDKK